MSTSRDSQTQQRYPHIKHSLLILAITLSSPPLFTIPLSFSSSLQAQREAELNVAMLTEKLTQLQQQMSEREEGLCGEVTQLKEELMSERTQTERVARALEATKTDLGGFLL